jgi:methyl-accepting chemotaxis protein
MTTLPLAATEHRTQLHRLKTFLTMLLPTLIGVTLVESALLFFQPSLALGLAGVATFLFALLAFLARSSVVHGNLQKSVTIMGVGFLTFALVMIIALPQLLTAVALLPVLAIIVVLPYVDSQQLKTWSIAVWIVSIIIVICGEFVALFPPLPALAINIIQFACIVPGVALLLLLVWQFHSRMTETLNETRSINSALQEAQSHMQAYVAELESANEAKIAREHLEEVVRTYSNFTHRVAQGDLTARLQINSHHDELALLGESLNTMVKSLQEITIGVQQASTAIASSAHEITTVTTQQASSIAQKSAAIHQTTTTIEEVKTIAGRVTKDANQVAQNIQASLQVARQGTQAIDETIAGMNEIRRQVEGIAQTIMSLSEQTQAIGTITKTVSELADQSNLLALNAAIEAARAGEQGKSFAVVAQQVRDLSERSKSATVQVRDILDEIQRATNNAVMATEEGSRGVEQGTGQAQDAGEVIKRIANEVESATQTNVQMAAASHEAATGMDQISQAMGSIQQSTNELVAGMRQAEQAARDLQTLAHSLQQASTAYQTQ